MQAGESRWHKEEKLEIRKVEVATTDPACWKRVELRIDAGGTYSTPFDPDHIAIDAVIRTPENITTAHQFAAGRERYRAEDPIGTKISRRGATGEEPGSTFRLSFEPAAVHIGFAG